MKKTLFLIVLCMLAFTACDNSNPEINIRMETDYSEIIDAIGDANRSLSNKLALIEAAMKNGLAENDALLGLIQEALSSMSGTLEEKLAAVEAVMKTRTTALETKLALVEAAVNKGFADSQTQRELLRQAVAAMGGSLEEKIAALDAAVKSETTTLETKLALVEEAVGLLDNEQQLALIRDAVASLEGSAQEKLDALSVAVASQTTRLETKFALIATAVEQGFADQAGAIDAVKTALDASLTDLDADLLQLKAAIASQLDTVAACMTPEAFSQALADVVSAINSETQTVAGMLAAIEKSFVASTSFSLTATWPAEASGLKSGWEKGDVIFVFFPNSRAPRYLRMNYDGAKWSCVEMEGTKASKGCLNFQDGTSNTMTAIYLPSGADKEVSASGVDYVFSKDTSYWYLTATLPYTVRDRSVSGTLAMHFPAGFVQFFLTDATASAAKPVELREPKMQPQGITGIAADGTLQLTHIAHGAPLRGYAATGAQKGYYFSGILNDDVRNVDTSYHFTLVEGGWKGDYYYRSVTTSLYRPGNSGRSLDLYPVSTWTRITDYKPIDMGCDWSYSNGEKQRVYWASRNLGATSENPDEEASYGNYYAWGETSPKTDYSSETYSGTEDDAALVALGGIWRMPKGGEWEILTGDQFGWTWKGNGYVVTSKVAGYDGADGPSLFIPSAGYYNGSVHLDKGSLSRYWSSTGTTTDKARVLASYDSSTPKVTYDMSRYLGLSVRPVTF